jgi:hypothetical protein
MFRSLWAHVPFGYIEGFMVRQAHHERKNISDLKVHQSAPMSRPLR